MPSRSLLSLLRAPGGSARAWLGLVLALAVALKLLVPQGWMPSPGGGLMLCPDAVPMARSVDGHGGASAHAAHGEKGQPAKSTASERCAFAGLGLAAVPAAPAPRPAPPRSLVMEDAAPSHDVAIGHGLAAPPPPATGPPASA